MLGTMQRIREKRRASVGHTLLRAGQYGDGAVADDDAGVWELVAEQPVLQRRRLGVQLVIVGGPRDHGERVSALEEALLLATVLRRGTSASEAASLLGRGGGALSSDAHSRSCAAS